MFIKTNVGRIINANGAPFWYEAGRRWQVLGFLYIQTARKFSKSLNYHHFTAFEEIPLWALPEACRNAQPARRRVRYKRPRIVDGKKKSY